MKKITLAVLAATFSYLTGSAQATYHQEAPPNTAVTSFSFLPNGSASAPYMRSIWFIHPYEMLPMNIATINSMTLQYTNGTGSTPVAGNFTVYLLNASGVMNWVLNPNASFDFPTNFALMSKVYDGTMTVPGTSGPATVPLNFTTPFNFTGGGMYVGIDWQATSTAAAGTASALCSHRFNTWSGLESEFWDVFSMSTAPVSSITVGNGNSNGRPAIIWGASNGATHELEVVDINALGTVSSKFNPQGVMSHIVNSGPTTVNNVSVAFVATGANPTNTILTIPTMTAGQNVQLIYAGYTPTNPGLSTISMSIVGTDDDPTNNVMSWKQTVSCTEIGQQPADFGTPGTNSISSGYGFTQNGGIFAMGVNLPSQTTVTGVKTSVFNYSLNIGKSLSAVLLDQDGNIIVTGPPTPITPGQTLVLPFSAPMTLSANIDYYLGVNQPAGGYYPMAWSENNDFVPYPYFAFPLAGGTPSTSYNHYYGYMMIQPQLQFDDLMITASSTRSVVCKADNRTMTLTANGTADTYSWSTNVGSVTTGSTVVVTPTLSTPSGTGTVTYSVTGTQASSGCKTNLAKITVTVDACTSTRELPNAETVVLFPNPTVAGKATIGGLSGKTHIQVFSTLGQLVMQGTTESSEFEVDLKGYAAGNYIIKVSDDAERIKILKLMHQ